MNSSNLLFLLFFAENLNDVRNSAPSEDCIMIRIEIECLISFLTSEFLACSSAASRLGEKNIAFACILLKTSPESTKWLGTDDSVGSVLFSEEGFAFVCDNSAWGCSRRLCNNCAFLSKPFFRGDTLAEDDVVFWVEVRFSLWASVDDEKDSGAELVAAFLNGEADLPWGRLLGEPARFYLCGGWGAAWRGGRGPVWKKGRKFESILSQCGIFWKANGILCEFQYFERGVLQILNMDFFYVGSI